METSLFRHGTLVRKRHVNLGFGKRWHQVSSDPLLTPSQNHKEMRKCICYKDWSTHSPTWKMNMKILEVLQVKAKQMTTEFQFKLIFWYVHDKCRCAIEWSFSKTLEKILSQFMTFHSHCKIDQKQIPGRPTLARYSLAGAHHACVESCWMSSLFCFFYNICLKFSYLILWLSHIHKLIFGLPNDP